MFYQSFYQRNELEVPFLKAENPDIVFITETLPKLAGINL